MKLESQMVALLTWMGKYPYDGSKETERYGSHPECCLPPLTLDLMHEATLELDKSLQRETVNQLCLITLGNLFYADDWHKIVHATKEQRLESLLRVLGKWVED